MVLRIVIGVVFIFGLFAACGFYDLLMKKHDKELKETNDYLNDL